MYLSMQIHKVLPLKNIKKIIIIFIRAADIPTGKYTFKYEYASICLGAVCFVIIIFVQAPNMKRTFKREPTNFRLCVIFPK